MLELRNISKRYKTGELVQRALDDVSISFRESEFVAVLGPSGSGKTTLLNIIGGLDRYDGGDLVINSVSTKKYSDRDWDAYRNHTIGFVFQNYNLIPHQSVLANVELALTISGVSRSERRRRAKEALESVGLGDQVHKRPNQMSGGQMQRVAIARALVNDPDVLLADEPTGALDSETSVQVMELLKKVAKDRLVIMVTHNGELADEYASRIVRLKDGKITGDSDPFEVEEEAAAPAKRAETGKKKKASMGFLTALSLSLNNLRTKKGRTILTAFAGSIGIIGIAMILALSTGIHNYVDDIQRETLSSYPVVLEKEPNNFLAGFAASREAADDETAERAENTVYSDPRIYKMFNAAFTGSGDTNDLGPFKTYLEGRLNAGENDGAGKTRPLSELVKAVQYDYGVKLNVYFMGTDGEYHDTDLTSAMFGSSSSDEENTGMNMFNMVASRMPSVKLWSELLPGNDGEPIHQMVYDQYDLVAGEWPREAGDILLVLNERGEISDNAFYALGLIEEEEIRAIFRSVLRSEEIDETERSATFDQILGRSFRLVLNSELYKRSEDADGTFESILDDDAALNLVVKNGYELRVVGIIRPNSSSSLPISGSFAYTKSLADYVIEHDNASALVNEQLKPENENLDLLTGLPFVLDEDEIPSDEQKTADVREYFAGLNDIQKVDTYIKILAMPDPAELDASVESYLSMYPTRSDMEQLAAATFGFSEEEIRSYLADYTDDELRSMMREQIGNVIAARYEEAARAQVMQLIQQNAEPGDLFGASGYRFVAGLFDQTIAAETDNARLAIYYDEFVPSSVSGSTLHDRLAEFGYIDLASPNSISIYAESFDDKEAITDAIKDYNSSVENEDEAIEYVDYVALLMSGVTTIIDAVSYGLIAFVTISLVVSSIMIGIITYISVLERTKEIGILRSIGASKRNISSVFNAETLIIGFFAGLIGIGITMLLCIPLNLILHKLTGIQTINAVLPLRAGLSLVLISMALTLISGLIPAGIAARKDPVAALRTE